MNISEADLSKLSGHQWAYMRKIEKEAKVHLTVPVRDFPGQVTREIGFFGKPEGVARAREMIAARLVRIVYPFNVFCGLLMIVGCNGRKGYRPCWSSGLSKLWQCRLFWIWSGSCNLRRAVLRVSGRVCDLVLWGQIEDSGGWYSRGVKQKQFAVQGQHFFPLCRITSSELCFGPGGDKGILYWIFRLQHWKPQGPVGQGLAFDEYFWRWLGEGSLSFCRVFRFWCRGWVATIGVRTYKKPQNPIWNCRRWLGIRCDVSDSL
jgi:hypothetical protein